MPAAIIVKFAKRAKKTQAEVEKIWNETKKEAKSKFNPADPHYWAYVTATTRNKLGLKEAVEKVSFKSFLLREKKKESEIPLSNYIQPGDHVLIVGNIPGVDILPGDIYSVSDVDSDCKISLITALGTKIDSMYFDKKYFEKINK